MPLTARALEAWTPRLALIGVVLVPIGLLPFVQWLYEETLLTAMRGPQALFFSLAHGHGFHWLGPLAVVGYFGFLVAPFFLLWLLVYGTFLVMGLRQKIRISSWHISLFVVAIVPPVLSLIPYDFWLAVLT